MLMPALKKMPAQRLINLQSSAKISDVVFRAYSSVVRAADS